MAVRLAGVADLKVLCDMDLSYVTDHVWQMQVHQNPYGVEVRFDTVRLPRPMKVDYPRHPDEFLPNWRQGECFLVAVDDENRPIAFLDMTARSSLGVGWIRNLGVEASHRRRGLATNLLRAARQWALEQELNKIVLDAQTKNYPAIRFAQKQGFAFCGYNDRYYRNGDIGLFFAMSL